MTTQNREAERASPNDDLADLISKLNSSATINDPDSLRDATEQLVRRIARSCQLRGWDTAPWLQSSPENTHPPADSNALVSLSEPTAQKVAIYCASFDPPTRAHRLVIDQLLAGGFDEVVVCPVGPKPGPGSHPHASPLHRAALVTLAFRGDRRIRIDYDDISHGTVTQLADLQSKYEAYGEIWHVVDRNPATIELESPTPLRFAVIAPQAVLPETDTLRVFQVESMPSSPAVRDRIYHGKPIDDLVESLVARYIHRHQLFVPYSDQRYAYFALSSPRLKIVADPRNQKSMAICQQFKQYESDDADLILVLGGDGTMLHAIREHWRSRLPFLGLNTGHLGFLMNESLDEILEGVELVSYTLPMLRVDAEAPDGTTSWGLAFSDVWLERAEGQAAWLRLDVDGETRIGKTVGDGMLIATASGSSAYARAMGAVPVPLNTPTVTLVGSNIFQPRFWKPMALPDNSVITLASLDRSGKRPVRGFIDGTSIGPVQQITVRRSLTASVEMAFTRQFEPSARLLRSLFPPNES